MMKDLRVSLVQGNTRWRDPDGNRAYYGRLISSLAGSTDLILLPETFTSGFLSSTKDQVEEMDGATVCWLIEHASNLGATVVGSVQIRVGNDLFNRLLFVMPDGVVLHYDKRHLFCFANEHKYYAAGRERITVQYKGWHICPLICYDLRFPVYSRNRYNVERENAPDYDLLLFVANWPCVRCYAWCTLLRARAVENLCFVAGVNRVGVDGNGIKYFGGSKVVDCMGHPISESGSHEMVTTTVLRAEKLLVQRKQFPIMADGDRFSIDY